MGSRVSPPVTEDDTNLLGPKGFKKGDGYSASSILDHQNTDFIKMDTRNRFASDYQVVVLELKLCPGVDNDGSPSH